MLDQGPNYTILYEGVVGGDRNVQIDIQTVEGEPWLESLAPIFLRLDGKTFPAFRCSAKEAQRLAHALLEAANRTAGHREA